MLSAGCFHKEPFNNFVDNGSILANGEIENHRNGVDLSGAGSRGELVLDVTEFGGGIENALPGIRIHPLTARMISEHPRNTAARNSRLFGYIINCNFPVHQNPAFRCYSNRLESNLHPVSG